MSPLDRLLRALGISRTQIRWRWDRMREKLKQSARSAENRSRVVRYEHKICPKCTHPADRKDTVCSVCGTKLGTLGGQRVGRALGLLFPPELPVVTLALIVACAALFISTMASSGDNPNLMKGPTSLAVLRSGAMSASWVLELKHYWRLGTSMFLHGGLVHLAMNMVGLYQLGSVFEQRWGRGRFLAIYVVSGVGAALVSAFWHRHLAGPTFSFENPFPPVVGASGAIFGLIGAGIASVSRRGARGFRELRGQLIAWALYGLVIGLAMQGRIDNASHVGGFLFGALCGAVAADSDSPRAWLPPRVWSVLLFVLVGALIFAFVLNQQNWPLDDQFRFLPGSIP